MDVIAPSDRWLKGRVAVPRSAASRLLASRAYAALAYSPRKKFSSA
jgi:hypothetical protein